MAMEQVTTNLAGTVRHAQMEGRSYLVAPMVMMAEGVLKGSAGALYYPREELAKTPATWNHKPVVVYHPETNGKAVSACDPDILTVHKVGVIMNTRFTDDGKLKAEAWLEEDRLKTVDSRVLKALEDDHVMELSTGLFTDNESMEGEFDGTPYEAIARNYRPDHLALLPDKKGAFPVESGAGLLRNQSADPLINKEKKMSIEKLVGELIANELSQWTDGDREFLLGLEESQLEKLEPIVNTVEVEKVVEKIVEKPAEPVANAEPKTVEEYVSNAPEGMRDMLMAGLQTHEAQRQQCIANIVANKANIFTAEDLATKKLGELKGIEVLAATTVEKAKPVANYSGAAAPAPTENAVTEEPYISPTLSWD